MNYDKIIIEMLSRIQTLEEKVAVLTTPKASEATLVEEVKVTTSDIRNFIEGKIEEAAADGEEYIVFKALDIHNAMKLTSKYPMVCNAMRQCMKEGDQVIYETQSGYSSTLEIKYLCKKM